MKLAYQSLLAGVALTASSLALAAGELICTTGVTTRAPNSLKNLKLRQASR